MFYGESGGLDWTRLGGLPDRLALAKARLVHLADARVLVTNDVKYYCVEGNPGELEAMKRAAKPNSSTDNTVVTTDVLVAKLWRLAIIGNQFPWSASGSWPVR